MGVTPRPDYIQRTCKHDQQFVCFATHSTELPSAVWACPSKGCGYWLNFDPSDYMGSVALLSGPSPEVAWKKPQKLNGGL